MSVSDQPTIDLAIRNGQIFDVTTQSFVAGDLLIDNGTIVALGDEVPAAVARQTIDASGGIVAPGLVDLHVHIFDGQDLGVDASLIGPRSGTTTFVDTGSAGAHLWGAFHRLAAQLPQRVRAFINIATIGTTSIRLQGELATGRYVDVDACVAAARSVFPAAGVKVRASKDVASANADPALRAARHAADELQLPLMVHLGPAPSEVETILDQLRPGDILTHCFTSFAENGLLVDGQLLPSVLEARDRGVIFDVGHGASGFDSATASQALELGFLPDTISTDLHAYSVDHVVDLPAVLTRFLALGASLEEVLTRSTAVPARVVGLDGEGVGHLRVGGVGDVAIFRLIEEDVEFVDVRGGRVSGHQRLTVSATVQSGVILYQRS